MRAALLEGEKFTAGSELKITGEKLHHFANVIRFKKGEALLLLDGNGSKAEGQITEIGKREMLVNVEKVSCESKRSGLSVAFALPKKDALEFCLRACAEIGAEKIYILESERAQRYPLKDERVAKILASGVEQSNNPFLPIVERSRLDSLPYDDFALVALASLAEKGASNIEGSCLLVIGPEGGFTAGEESLVLAKDNAFALNFEGPILRTQTAIPFFGGMLASKNFL